MLQYYVAILLSYLTILVSAQGLSVRTPFCRRISSQQPRGSRGGRPTFLSRNKVGSKPSHSFPLAPLFKAATSDSTLIVQSSNQWWTWSWMPPRRNIFYTPPCLSLPSQLVLVTGTKKKSRGVEEQRRRVRE